MKSKRADEGQVARRRACASPLLLASLNAGRMMASQDDSDRAIQSRPQSGVIPYRHSRGRLEVMLVTAASGLHWTIPKGKLEPDLAKAESALQEAYEEAGLIGRVEARSLGSYCYRKRGCDHRVHVFPMAVSRQLRSWPEMWWRERRWFSVSEAASRLKVGGLRRCLRLLEARWSRRAARSRRCAA